MRYHFLLTKMAKIKDRITVTWMWRNRNPHNTASRNVQ